MNYKSPAYVAHRLAQWLCSPIGQYLLLAVVTLLAAVLRFYKLGEWSFWGDEVFTIGTKQDDFNHTFWRQSLAISLIHGAMNLLGTSEWSARFVPAIIGVISIPALYFSLRRGIGTKAAFIASVLLAVSPWHLYWSQNARFYSLLLLLYSLALIAAFIGFEEDRPWYLLISLVLLGLAARERLLALFFLPVVISYLVLIYLLPFAKPAGLRWRNLILFFAPGTMLAALFVGRYVRNLDRWMAGGFGFSNNSPFWITASIVYYIGVPLICIAATGAAYFLSRRNRAALFFSLGALLPPLILVAISPFHYTANRYVFVSLTSWVALAGMAVAALWAETTARSRLLAIGPLLILLSFALSENILYYRYQNGNRDNWRAAFEFIQKHDTPDDLVVAANKSIGDYYMQAETIALGQFDPASSVDNLRRIWFVEDMTAANLHPQQFAWVKKNTTQVADFDVQVHARNFKMRVYLYEPATAWPVSGSVAPDLLLHPSIPNKSHVENYETEMRYAP